MVQTMNCRALRGASFVTVVQAAEAGNRHDLAVSGRGDRAGYGRIFIQGQVRPRLQVVLDVPGQGATQAAFVDDDDVIEALATDGAD
jgi:hypothetical protein